MKPAVFIIAFLCTWFLVLIGQSYGQIGEIVDSFPSPASRPTGLTFDGRYLWNADIGTNQIYQIDPATGAVVKSIPAPPGSTVNGLSWDGSNIWCSDNQNNVLNKINPKNGSVLNTLQIPTASPRGVTYDGSYLWYQESGDRELYKLDPSTGAIEDMLISPAGANRGLAWDGKYLWSADHSKNEIYMLNPDRGSVITILYAPGTYSYGLTFDGEYIWNADYETDRIYKIQIQGQEKYRLSHPYHARIRYSVKVWNAGQDTMDLQTFLAYPHETLYQTLDDLPEFSPQPQFFINDKYSQQIACYRENLEPAEERFYQWSAPATLYNIRYYLRPENVGTINDIPQSILDLYTTDGDKYKITDPTIIAAAQEAIGNETNLYWQVRQIHDYVISHIEYVNDNQWDDAPTVLAQGHGSCSEYSYLFIAICRAAGIPARYEAGGHRRDVIPYEDRVYHRWHQVYFPEFGWIPIDSTWDDKSYPSNQARYFGALSNTAFSTTIGGGGEHGLWWSYNSANSSSGGTRKREKLFEWLPSTTDYLTQVAVGGGYSTAFNWVNTGVTTASGNLILTGQSGEPFSVNILQPAAGTEDAGATKRLVDQGSTFPFSIEPGATLFLTAEALNPSDEVESGWARVEYAGGSLGGVATFKLAEGDVLQALAGVLASQPLNAATIPVDNDAIQDRYTGFAVANPNAEDINIQLVTLDANGGIIDTVAPPQLNPLGPGNQITGFLHQILPSRLNFRGSMVLEAENSKEYVATALVLSEGQLTAIPIIAGKAGDAVAESLQQYEGEPAFLPRQVSLEAVCFSHMAVGAGFSTYFSLLNSGNIVADGNLIFTDQEGVLFPILLDNYTANGELGLGGRSASQGSSFPVTIAPGASLFLEAKALDSENPTQTGWARLEYSGGILDGVGTFQLKQDGALRAIAGVLACDPMEAATIPIDNDESLRCFTGFGVANPGNENINIRVIALDEEGVVSDTIDPPELNPLGPQEQVARFLHQYLESKKTFRGSMVLIAENGKKFVVTALVENQGLYSAIPVIPGKAPHVQYW